MPRTMHVLLAVGLMASPFVPQSSAEPNRAPIMLRDGETLEVPVNAIEKGPDVTVFWGRKFLKYELDGKTYFGVAIRTHSIRTDSQSEFDQRSEFRLMPDGSVSRSLAVSVSSIPRK